MVRIRLRRTGKKKQPSYRVVVADSEAPRDGRFIENIGFYSPRTDPSTVEIDADRHGLGDVILLNFRCGCLRCGMRCGFRWVGSLPGTVPQQQEGHETDISQRVGETLHSNFN